MKENIMLLTLDYRIDRREERPYLRLFGKTKDGRIVVGIVNDFKPYFYLRAPTPLDVKQLGVNPKVLSVSVETLKIGKAEKPEKMLRVTTKLPSYVKELRNNLEKSGREVFGADIVFANRYLFDNDVGLYITLEGDIIERHHYNADLILNIENIEKCTPFKCKLSTMSIDIETSMSDDHIYTICTVMDDGEEQSFSNDDEFTLLTEFEKYYIDKNPDILTGYNIYGFDLPRINQRCEKYNMKFPWGRDRYTGKPMFSNKVKTEIWEAPGILIVDAWLVAKTEIRPQRETLDFVAKLFGFDGKHDIDATKIDELWESRREDIIKYCIHDARLALQIIEKLNILDKILSISTTAMLPLKNTIIVRESNLIDSILIRECIKRNIAIPCMRWNNDMGVSYKIEGGHVEEQIRGLHKWVTVLDYKSMYPSIIIKKKICFSTDDILPNIMVMLGKKRTEYKSNVKESGDYYDRLQDSIKILMNAFYGVFCSNFYRFTNKNIGELITSTARENIKKVIKDLKQKGIPVIASDTDSVLIRLLRDNYKETRYRAEQLATEYSKEGYELEFEKVFRTYFTHGKKKRYAGVVVNEDGTEELFTRGYETRRGDVFPYLQKSLDLVFDALLKRGDADGACRIASSRVRNIKKANIENLILSMNVKKVPEYKYPERIAGVQAVLKLKARGLPHIWGTKASWVVVDGSTVPQTVEPYLGENTLGVPDFEYYEEWLIRTMLKIVDVFGWDETALKSGLVQEKLI